MKTIGIIAEYNPFHNGHAYQIQKARQLSRADHVIIAMSGNFVQRGTPAILDKFSRTAMALQNGADFVFEIPAIFATSSAEHFAAAGVALFDALGCVDAVSFGCETPDLPLMSYIADILVHEPKEYKALLSCFLNKGCTFPAAREQAVLAYLKTKGPTEADVSSEAFQRDAAALLGTPNNILALEYLKAIKRSHSSLKPLPILRKGGGYHDDRLQQDFCSAAAIRKHLLSASSGTPKNQTPEKALSDFVPKSTAACLLGPDAAFLTEQDFSGLLYYRLLRERETGFADYADCSGELSNRIRNTLPRFRDYRGFCEQLKSKEVTYSRISRVLLHILLGITDADLADGTAFGFAPYLRLLGFRRDAAALFGNINAHARRPIVTKPAKADALLSPRALSVFQKDVFSSDLYYGMLMQKNDREQTMEYRREMVISDGAIDS